MSIYLIPKIEVKAICRLAGQPSATPLLASAPSRMSSQKIFDPPGNITVNLSCIVLKIARIGIFAVRLEICQKDSTMEFYFSKVTSEV